MKERAFDVKNGCAVSCHPEKNYVKILNVLKIEKSHLEQKKQNAQR